MPLVDPPESIALSDKRRKAWASAALERPLGSVRRAVSAFAGLELGFILPLAVIAGWAMLQLALATPHGPQIYADSFYYVAGSENLAGLRGFGRLSGGGDFIPITKFPPFYSLAMAALQRLGLDRLASAYAINLSCYGLSALVAGLLVRRATGSKPAGLLAGLLIGISPILLSVHIGVMSEPLFLLLSLAAIALCQRSLIQDSTASLLASAVLASLALLTRYIGVALVGACAAVLWLQRPGSKSRLQRLSLFLGIGLTPMGLWFLRNAIQTGNAANRLIRWTPVGLEHLRSLALHTLEWFVPPYLVRGALFALGWMALLAALAVTAAVLIRRAPIRTERSRPGNPALLLGVFILFYLAALAVSLSLFDPDIPVDSRILSPVYAAVMLLFALTAHALWRRPERAVRAGLIGLILALLSWNVVEQVHHARTLRAHDLQYPPRHLAESGTVAALEAMQRLPLISNAVDRLYFASGRYSYSIPLMTDPRTQTRRPSYNAELQQMRQRLRQECAVLVLFDPESHREDVGLIDDLTMGLQLVGRYSDGVLYRDPGAEGRCGL